MDRFLKVISKGRIELNTFTLTQYQKTDLQVKKKSGWQNWTWSKQIKLSIPYFKSNMQVQKVKKKTVKPLIKTSKKTSLFKWLLCNYTLMLNASTLLSKMQKIKKEI